jgi:hypothetical protein
MYEKIREMKALEIHGDKKNLHGVSPGHAARNAVFWKG